jgi:isoleucyl-tRNA synthetase
MLLERRFEIARQIATACANARQKAALPLRWPLEEVRIVSESTEVLSAVEHLSQLIEPLANVRSVKVSKQPKTDITMKINRAKVGAKFKKESPAAQAALEKVAPVDIEKWLLGKEPLYVIPGEFAIERDMVELTETAEGFAIAPFEEGKAYLKTHINKELYAEAMVREVARRVQLMRKEKRLVETDRISLYIHTDEKELLELLKKNEKGLTEQVNAEKASFTHHTGGFHKEWEIGEAAVQIAIEKK